MTFQTEHQKHEIDDEQQHNGGFQNQHPPVRAVVLQELVKIVEGLEFLIDGAVPVRQVKTRGDALIKSGQMPVAEEFGDVRKFIAETGEVDANLAKSPKDLAAAPNRATPQIAICAVSYTHLRAHETPE